MQGYFTDEGEAIDFDSIEIPALCERCRVYKSGKGEISCNLNRFDQQKEVKKGKEFLCGAFESK